MLFESQFQKICFLCGDMGTFLSLSMFQRFLIEHAQTERAAAVPV